MAKKGKINERMLLNILMILFFFSFITFYIMLDKYIINPEDEIVNVTRVVDGDTIKINDSEGKERTIRFLGINTPESGEEYFDTAKIFLESLIEGKNVKLSKDSGSPDKDKYGRDLRYVYFEGEFVNKLLVEKGLANVYVLEPIEKEKELRDSWKKCLREETNLCEQSNNTCAGCIELDILDKTQEFFILKNTCGYECNITEWSVKDEGRNLYVLPEILLSINGKLKVFSEKGENTNNEIFLGCNELWTDEGDSLFLRDAEGKLVLYYNY